MDTGVKISLGLHAGLIAAALSSSLFSHEEEKPLEVAEVSLMSADEFADLMPDAPRASNAPTQPEPSVEDTEVAIARPEPEPTPVEPVIEPDVLPEIPTAPETPEAPENPEVQPEPEVTPKPADRIAPEAAPEAPADAEEAPVKTEAPKPEPAPEKTPEVAPKEVEQAPKEATTQIVTEADQPKTKAPIKSERPKTRPKNLPKPQPKVAEKPKEAPKPKPKAPDNTANDILKAIEADQAKQKAAKPSTTNGTGGGTKLSTGEINGLILKVQDCWSVPVGLRNAANLVVTLRVELSPHGRLVDVPRLIEPQGALSSEQTQAFESARRALIACQPYQLPKEKYESWNTMEVVFNPKKMVLRQ